MSRSPKIHPVVLCGGSGTRLWPLSRKSYPKQFSRLVGEESLLQATIRRLAGEQFAPPILMTGNDFRFVVGEQLSAIGTREARIVVEPAGRNTAPAIYAAARMVAADDPDGLILVAPSDHVLHDTPAFHAAIEAAAAAAGADGSAVTFGIRPDRAETGYGYIELAEAPGDGAPSALPYQRFTEKPDEATAEEMVASGRYLWNSGIFLFPVSTVSTAFTEHMPDLAEAVEKGLAEARHDLDFLRLGDGYAESPDISVDYAIMERIPGKVVPMSVGWNDLGSWATVWGESSRDPQGVATSNGSIAIDCENTLLRSEQEEIRVVGIGLKDTVAVATRDAVLVADMNRAHDVREAVTALRLAGADQAEAFPRVHRPWGWYETLVLGGRFQVKQIMVHPGAQLSLQSHVHRSEHWVVVAGTARITVGNDERILAENESVYIPLGATHRLANPGKIDLHLIEVQTGAYLGEDDIVRYEDVYARV
ncbi:MAG: mannose-1-phosphate guanylyltransferase/mannose-6-phosphate isomerase [Pseudomonadota bacterium]